MKLKKEQITLVFDYDGTLQDTFVLYKPAVYHAVKWLQSQGIDIETPSEAKIKSWLGATNNEMWDEFAPGIPFGLREEGIRKIGFWMQQIVEDGTFPWFDGTEEVLDELYREGYHFIILSNCSCAYAEFIREKFTMDRWFEKYIACESFDWKPKYEVLSLLMKKQSKQKYIMIGDRSNDRDAAIKNKIPFIACCYGYAKEGELDGADSFAVNIKELPLLISKISEKII